MKALIFDWDNTIVNSWDLLERAVNYALHSMGKPEITMDRVQHNAHLSTKDSFPRLFGDSWVQAQTYFYDFIEGTHLQDLCLLEGAENLIDFLHHKKIPMAIVSNKKNDILNKEIKHLGWGDRFAKVVGSGDALRDKPNPDPALLACKYLDCKSEDIYFIGDSLPDWQCAKAIGAKPIALAPEYKDHEDFPGLYFSTLTQLHNFLHCEFEK